MVKDLENVPAKSPYMELFIYFASGLDNQLYWQYRPQILSGLITLRQCSV